MHGHSWYLSLLEQSARGPLPLDVASAQQHKDGQAGDKNSQQPTNHTSCNHGKPGIAEREVGVQTENICECHQHRRRRFDRPTMHGRPQASKISVTVFTHLLMRQPSRPGPVHLQIDECKELMWLLPCLYTKNHHESIDFLWLQIFLCQVMLKAMKGCTQRSHNYDLNFALSCCINITTGKCLQHRELLCQVSGAQEQCFYPWVQFLWQSWHTFISSAYFHTSASSSPGTPCGQRDTQNRPSWKLAHLVQFPEPWRWTK